MSYRLEVFRINPLTNLERTNISRAIGSDYEIKADRYSERGRFMGRLLVTKAPHREIIETSEKGFVQARCNYDF